jgi:hypothetical protein
VGMGAGALGDDMNLSWKVGWAVGGDLRTRKVAAQFTEDVFTRMVIPRSPHERLARLRTFVHSGTLQSFAGGWVHVDSIVPVRAYAG